MFTAQALLAIARHVCAKHQEKFPIGTHFIPFQLDEVEVGDTASGELLSPRMIGVPSEWAWQENYVTIPPSKSLTRHGLRVFRSDTPFTAVMDAHEFSCARTSHEIVIPSITKGIQIRSQDPIQLPVHEGPDGTFWVAVSDLTHLFDISMAQLCNLASILPEDPETQKIDVLFVPFGDKLREGVESEVASAGKLLDKINSSFEENVGVDDRRLALHPGTVFISDGLAQCMADLVRRGFVRSKVSTHTPEIEISEA